MRSPRPVDALLEVAGEREAGLLVFGPDRCAAAAAHVRADGAADPPARLVPAVGGRRRAVSAAPDLCEPVHGWRLWFVVMEGGRARLMSPVYPIVWRPGREIEAVCDARRRELLRPWRLRPAEHAAPDVRCGCGVHAVSVPSDLAAYVPSVAARRIVHRVIGRVSLWGEVVEGSRGWRGRTPIPPTCGCPRCTSTAGA